jgi:epoxide hydrolase-like predicted phosphatase
MIKAIIFDLGGVILRTEDRAPRASLEQRLGLASGDADEIVFNSEMGRRAQLGLISSAALWAWVQQHLNLTDEGLQDFQHNFWAGDRVDEELMRFIRSLRPKYRTAIISNAMDNLNEVVAGIDPTGDAFDLVVGSAYENVMKPDAAIFERTLARLGLEGPSGAAAAVFIDDFAHNVHGAQAVGMHGLLYRADRDLPAELARLGVSI